MVHGVVGMEIGCAVVELWSQDGIGTGHHISSETGQEQQVHRQDQEKAEAAKLHPFVSNQSQTEGVPVHLKDLIQRIIQGVGRL